MKKLTQSELDAIIEKHSVYLHGVLDQGEKADFSRKNLSGLSFEDENLAGANFYRAQLDGCNLRSTNLDGANLEGASLKGADLTSAYAVNAEFTDAQMSAETCLDQVNFVESGDGKLNAQIAQQLLEYLS